MQNVTSCRFEAAVQFHPVIQDRYDRLLVAAQDFFAADGDLVAQAQAQELMERVAGDIAIFRGASTFGDWKAARDYMVHEALARAEALV
jgi:hypothetical protein